MGIFLQSGYNLLTERSPVRRALFFSENSRHKISEDLWSLFTIRCISFVKYFRETNLVNWQCMHALHVALHKHAPLCSCRLNAKLQLLQDNSWEASVGVGLNVGGRVKSGPQSWWSGLDSCWLVFYCRSPRLKMPSWASESSHRGNCSCSLDTSRFHRNLLNTRGEKQQSGRINWTPCCPCDLWPDWVWHPCSLMHLCVQLRLVQHGAHDRG